MDAGSKPAEPGPVEIDVEAYDRQPMLLGNCILVSVVEVKPESGDGVKREIHILGGQRQNLDTCIPDHIQNELAEGGLLALPHEQQPDGMESEAGNEHLVAGGTRQQIPGLVGL